MKTLNERLAWLAGIIDGEGTVSLQINSRQRYRKKLGRKLLERSIAWKVDVSNTNSSIIAEVVSILDALEIGYFFGKYNLKAKNAKPLTKVVMNGKPRVVKILSSVLPWLVGKKPQAEILLKAAAYRGTLGYHRKVLDDPRLIEATKLVRKLNQRGTDNQALARSLYNISAKEVTPNVVGGRSEDNIPTEICLRTVGVAGGE